MQVFPGTLAQVLRNLIISWSQRQLPKLEPLPCGNMSLYEPVPRFPVVTIWGRELRRATVESGDGNYLVAIMFLPEKADEAHLWFLYDSVCVVVALAGTLVAVEA